MADNLRFGQQQQQTPGWGGFNANFHCDDVIRPSVIGCLPIIPHSPTELSMVYCLLQRSLAIANLLNQWSVPIVLDQVTCAKANEVI